MCFVYIIKAGMAKKSPIKIGVANSPERRLRQMQTGNHVELFLLYKIPMPSRAVAYRTENDLHRKLKDWRIRNEWFNGRALKLIKVKDIIANLEKYDVDKYYIDPTDLELVYEQYEIVSDAMKHIG